MNLQNFYKIASIGLFAIFATMVTPYTILDTSDSVGLTMYGMADVILRDDAGNVIFTQSIHNAVTDEGEDYILEQLFSGTPAGQASNIASICITDANLNSLLDPTNTDPITIEDLNVSNILTTLSNTYDPTLQDCLTDDQVELITPTDQTIFENRSIAVIGPLEFTASTPATNDTPAIAGNLDADKQITALLICQKDSTTVCTNTLFAVISTSIPPLSAGSSATVTYSLDITTHDS